MKSNLIVFLCIEKGIMFISVILVSLSSLSHTPLPCFGFLWGLILCELLMAYVWKLMMMVGNDSAICSMQMSCQDL